MKNNPPAFIPDFSIDPFERELAYWVSEARSRHLLSLAQQIALLEKWNALWDKAIE
jgi:hypothetical protein